jgi:transposase
MKITAQVPVIGMDIAKNTFQIHAVDPETGEIERIKLKRAKVAEFFANRQPSLVALEACGGGHHWARTLSAQGHQVKLLPARHVKAFVLRDKTDARDAQAIWVAAQQPHIREVPVKSEQQQACLAQHRMRAQLMKMRIMQTNSLRGLLYEFGIALPEGHRILLQRVKQELARAEDKLPGAVTQSVLEQLVRVDRLQEDIDHIDKRLATLGKQNQQMLALQTVPGIGPLTATALVSSATDINTFETGRQFAAWLGLTPRQTGTGGKVRQLGLSKRGDAYVRTLLMHGARAVIARSVQSAWVQSLLARRPYNVVVAALANKLARTAWAVLTKGKAFDQARWNRAEVAAP